MVVEWKETEGVGWPWNWRRRDPRRRREIGGARRELKAQSVLYLTLCLARLLLYGRA